MTRTTAAVGQEEEPAMAEESTTMAKVEDISRRVGSTGKMVEVTSGIVERLGKPDRDRDRGKDEFVRRWGGR